MLRKKLAEGNFSMLARSRAKLAEGNFSGSETPT